MSLLHSQNLAEQIVAFGRILRAAGLDVGTAQIIDALQAVKITGLRSRADFYQALYSVFITRHEQVELFRQAFALFFGAARQTRFIDGQILQRQEVMAARHRLSPRVRKAFDEEWGADNDGERHTERDESEQHALNYSAWEVLRRKDFAEFTSEEIAQAKQMLADMSWSPERRRTRRFTPSASGRHIDMRRSMRHAFRNQGEVLRLKRKVPDSRLRQVTILCDISGSMERYSRMLLHFMHVFSGSGRQVETFVFGTRLTRITRTLRHRDIDDAVAGVASKVNDWAGGTRIGEALKAFNFQWARRVLRSGAVVLIISDGWDRGDIPLLHCEMQRLARSCRRLVWLNPLLGQQDYQPLTRGMQAALPYIDDFLPVHNLASLQELGKILGKV